MTDIIYSQLKGSKKSQKSWDETKYFCTFKYSNILWMSISVSKKVSPLHMHFKLCKINSPLKVIHEQSMNKSSNVQSLYSSIFTHIIISKMNFHHSLVACCHDHSTLLQQQLLAWKSDIRHCTASPSFNMNYYVYTTSIALLPQQKTLRNTA